ncbi:alpha/beta fold hydrolase, partial [bacterium LRH843]|nr:alpha/beta fold hydrolase [bacterium LRH843]
DEILAKAKAGEAIPPAYHLTDMAQDVTGLMDALGIGTAHIFGISMGGAITQALATEHADRLRSATIVMTACRPLIAADQAAA